MAGIGFAFICEDVAYDNQTAIFYAKNPYDVIILDNLPTNNRPFHILLSLYSLVENKTYPLTFTFYDPDMDIISEIKIPLTYISNPPKGKKATGAITVNIKSKNISFTKEGVHKIKIELFDPSDNARITKYIEFPVFLKSKKEGKTNEQG